MPRAPTAKPHGRVGRTELSHFRIGFIVDQFSQHLLQRNGIQVNKVLAASGLATPTPQAATHSLGNGCGGFGASGRRWLRHGCGAVSSRFRTVSGGFGDTLKSHGFGMVSEAISQPS
jgi:hypothetical protein